MRLKELLKPSSKKTVAVAMAQLEPIIECVEYAQKEDMADFILIGAVDRIKELAKKRAIDLSNIEFIELDDGDKACQLAVDLVNQGRAQVVMKGLTHTATILRALLKKENKMLAVNGGLISQVSVFDLPKYHKVFFFTDPAININADLPRKVQILKNALGVARTVGMIKPKVACVAPIEIVNPQMPSTVHAAELTKMHGEFGDAIVDGPMGLDVAFSKEAAELKGIESSVAGDADIILMPTLTSANTTYKAFTVFGGATVSGAVVGIKAPVVLTSRSDSEETKLLSLKLALCIEPEGAK